MELPATLKALNQKLFSLLQSEQEARLILFHRTGKAWADIISNPDCPVSDECLKTIRDDVALRLAGKPLSRIYGEREFWGLRFVVTPDTLDPRPDTETIIERALISFAQKPPETILDLGTGTGCILIALLSEFKNARGIAVDCSFAALKIAQKNAALNQCENRARFVCGNWFDSIDKKFDLVVSNPPYISNQIIPTLAPEVRNHDPLQALDGGTEGLCAYKEIFSGIKKIMNHDAKAFFEIGYDQGEDVLRLARNAGFIDAMLHHDIAGRARVVEISRGDKVGFFSDTS